MLFSDKTVNIINEINDKIKDVIKSFVTIDTSAIPASLVNSATNTLCGTGYTVDLIAKLVSEVYGIKLEDIESEDQFNKYLNVISDDKNTIMGELAKVKYVFDIILDIVNEDTRNSVNAIYRKINEIEAVTGEYVESIIADTVVFNQLF